MDTKKTEPSFEPVAKGNCQFQRCTSPAVFRASWALGIMVKLVCVAHKSSVEGKTFEEIGPVAFGSRPMRHSA
jgi:hypothetical protein